MQAQTGMIRFLSAVCFLLMSAPHFSEAGDWGPWSDWSVCSKTCGMGLQMRERFCDSEPCLPTNGKTETRNCDGPACPPPTCGGTLTAPTGVITSPNYPDNYPNNFNCTWLISVQEGYKIDFKFEKFVLVPGCEDRLTIIESGTVPDKYCSQRTGASYGTVGNVVTINFQSDALMSATGFKITYEEKVIPNCIFNFCLNSGTCNGIDTCSCEADENYGFYRCGYDLYRDSRVQDVAVTSPRDLTSSCVMYGTNHVKTFDGRLYRFTGKCQYVMVKTEDLEVLIKRKSNCDPSTNASYTSCIESVMITKNSVTLTIFNNLRITLNGESVYPPVQQDGFEVTFAPWIVFVGMGNHRLEIDRKFFSIYLKVDPKYAGSTVGLCGNMNGDQSDDFKDVKGSALDDAVKFSNSWIRNTEGGVCSLSTLADQVVCTSEDIQQTYVCNVLKTEPFSKCREHIDVTPYMDQCLEDLCRCRPSVSSDCHCSVVSQFARECAKLGHEPNGWRTHTSCYRSCLGNQQYVECASACASTCENAKRNYCSTECTGGCECAPDTYWDASIEKCVLLQSCSCTHAGKFYKAGATRQEKCENCVCTAAKWTCNKVDCPATALAYGFSHFTTFDGSHFNYPGRCTYRFVSHKSWNLFDILIATKECGSGGRFTCVRKVYIKLPGSSTITLHQGNEVSINNNAATSLPFTTGPTGISVYQLSSLYVSARIHNLDISILWNGRSTVIVEVPALYKETLIGLGGRYNLKTTDDLTTAYGYESTQIDFGNSWEVYQKCDDIPVSGNQKDACADNQYLANDAETNCRIITTGEAFAACRLKLNGDRYFEACKFDVCACETGNDCYCDAIALFAQRCLEVGVAVDWRTPESCGLTCSGGKTYQVNGTSCGRTCRSITEQRTCTKNDYVEGCNCPEDTYLSSDGTCVTLDLCPCFHENSWIQAGHVVHQNNIACFCVNGAMSCNRPVGADDTSISCPATMQVLNCSELEPGNPGAACAKTCLTRNSMNCEGLTCQSGCKCPDGLVIYNGACIEPTTCPCEFQGKVYQVGNTTKSGCAVIECTTTGWKEISRDKCYTTCSAVGGAYYKTFDGLRTSFRGSCEYLMATDNCWGNNDNYDYRITVKSHDCPGSNNAMCATTVTAILGYTKVTLEKGQEPKQEILSSRGAIIKYHVNIKTRGIFTIVDTRLIRIIWDNSTRVYLQFKEEMMNQTQCGLCGNNNGDGADDKKAPNGDLPVTDVAFANSWKTSELCANIPEKNVTESCGSKLTWAQKKCAVIQSEVFAECRAKIDSDYFYEKCVEETCSCDTGGDCECFCTAVSDYAFQCGQNGVPVSWRNPDTCPLMCESYNTDDNCLWKYAPCSDVCIHTCCTTCIDGCFEGCHPKCTNGTIFNEQSNTCVKPLDCPDKCILSPTLPPICDAKNVTRVCSWTDWLNSHSPTGTGEYETVENVKNTFGVCSSSHLENIECRSRNHVDGTLQKNVLCDKNSGLLCTNEHMTSGTCDDYEVRLECCSCGCDSVTCSNLTCDRHETQTLVTAANGVDVCCDVYNCTCAGCWAEEFKAPGSKWTAGCYEYTCLSDNAGCYNIQKTKLPCSDDVTCPDYANKKSSLSPGACCETYTCECKPEFSSEYDLNCTHPNVQYSTVLTDGTTECVKHNCTCPDRATMNETCVAPVTCTASGCHREDTEDCDCLLTSECVCNPADCPVPKTCSKCETRQLVPPLTTPDNCALDRCCETAVCKPVVCNTTSVTCEPWEKKENSTTNNGCCIQETCVCDVTKEHLCPGARQECPYFGKLVKSKAVYGSDMEPDECCGGYECECLPKFDPSNVLTCSAPEVQDTTRLINGTLECSDHKCICPGHEEMNETCVERANCSASGCHRNETENCDCVVSSECVCNPADCSVPKTCSKCETRQLVPPLTTPDNCALDRCCETAVCTPLVCNETSANCQPFESEYVVDSKGCCTEYGCRCDKCVDEALNVQIIGNVWEDAMNECISWTCVRSNTTDECPLVEVFQNRTNDCIPNIKDCENHYISVEDTSDPCCLQYKCVCNTSFCPPDPECVYPSELVPDTEASNECCEVKKCSPVCVYKGLRFKKGETWDHPHDDCLSSMCSCDYNKCDIVDVPRYECPAAPMTTCATRQQPMRVTNADNKCCSHYECPCLCSVFGDPHYITFDGRQYTFMGECHYTLAKYRDSDKFHIYSDNTVCVRTSEFVGTCLKKIFIKWDSTLVQISYVESYDYAQAVKVNGTTLTSLPWSKGGIVVRYEFKSIVVTIPEINLWMKYLLTRMPAVFIKVSPTLMFNKTVGLCGTCTNQQLDDYEGSNGTLIGGSTEFGYDWEVNVTDEECKRCDAEKNPACYTCDDKIYEDNLMPLPEWCKNCTEAHCQALVAPAFAECNKVHPPSGFVKACQYDASALSKCDICNSAVAESYATLCLGSGMCVDWRKDNNCSMECSGDLVYRSCLNKCTAMQTCDNYLDECESEELEAGCFCPDGLILDPNNPTKCKDPDCCSCPADPVCEPNEELLYATTPPESCCPEKVCVCKELVEPECITPKVLLHTNDTKCPQPYCGCPIDMAYCVNATANCTTHLGCREKSLVQDICGCVLKSQCVCNSELCPEPPECGDCMELTTLETVITGNVCEDCCQKYQCKREPCENRWENVTIPGGCELVFTDNSTKCCSQYKLKCDNCINENGTFHKTGSSWYEVKEDCRVKYICSEVVNVTGTPYHIKVVDHDPRDHCTSKDQYESENCKIDDEYHVAVEIPSSDPCCSNHTCQCNCPDDYVPPPDKDTLKPYEELDVEDKCCANWTIKCEACLLENGSSVAVGESIQVDDGSGCEVTKYCSSKKISGNESACHEMEVSNDPRDYCTSKDQYETANCKNDDEYHVAVEVPSSDPCCSNHTCQCSCPDDYVPPPDKDTLKPYEELDVEDKCCANWTIKCEACLLENGSSVAVGESIQVDDGSGCVVTKYCSSKKIIGNESACHEMEISNDPRQNCVSRDQFEKNYCASDEVAQETVSQDPCCKSYRCVCGDPPPGYIKPPYICSYPREVMVTFPNSTDCFKYAACLCDNNTETVYECHEYYTAKFTCTAEDRHIVEVIRPKEEVTDFNKCCPKFDCPCKECNTTENVTCPDGFIMEDKKMPYDCCAKNVCVCNSCETSDGALHNFYTTWVETDAEGCALQYGCYPSSDKNERGCRTPKAMNDTCPAPTTCSSYETKVLVVYNETHLDPNLCCPEYKCECNSCGPDYVPAPNPDELKCEYLMPYNETENPNQKCCPLYHKKCLPCGTLADFETEYCEPMYEHAVELPRPNDTCCCPMFKCVCNSPDVLDSICDVKDINAATCAQLGRMNITYSVVNDTFGCCQEPSCKCYTGDELKKECGKNTTTCEYGMEEQPINSGDQCCEMFQCKCSTCPSSYNQTKPAEDNSYEEWREETLEENPLQKCCPRWRKSCTGNHTDCSTIVCDADKYPVQEGMKDCCPAMKCKCRDAEELNCPELESCKNGETSKEYFEPDVCCPKVNCSCGPCGQNYTKYPPGTLEPYEEYELVTPENVCCPTYIKKCGNVSLCKVPDCEANHTAVTIADLMDPDTDGCCPLYKCRCDVCHSEYGTFKVGDTWKKDIGGGCMVTYECTKHRLGNTTSFMDLEKCHKSEIKLDPSTHCKSEIYHDTYVCNSYQTAVEYFPVPDPNTCCSEYKCICKEEMQLQMACSNFTKEVCGEHMHSIEHGTISGTTDCCPDHACVCNNDTMLRNDCDQWTDYTCNKPGYERIQTNTVDKTNGPCCPTYTCQCKPEEELRQECVMWNHTCSVGERRERNNTDCCPTYECVCDKCVMDEGIYPVNVSWVSPDDICTKQTCVLDPITGCPAINPSDKYDCPYVDTDDCIKKGGSILGNESTSGCCKICNPITTPCERTIQRETINATVDGHLCWTATKHDIAFCSGSCQTSQSYDEHTGESNGICRCCKSDWSSKRTYSLSCDDGINRDHQHIEIMSCGCEETACEATATSATPFIP